MTYEEAIETLKHEHDYAQLLSYVNEALKMAISALEKQMPQKPTIDEYDDGTYSYICPRGAEAEENQVYCDICGQALDWGEEEEE